MSISYGRVNQEIFKIAKGMGYTVKMYDQDGNGPIANPMLAMYMYLEPDGIMISLPEGVSSEYDEVFFYKGALKDTEKFKKLVTRIRNVMRGYGVGVTIRNFDSQKKMSPSDFSYKVRANKEEERYDNQN